MRDGGFDRGLRIPTPFELLDDMQHATKSAADLVNSLNKFLGVFNDNIAITNKNMTALNTNLVTLQGKLDKLDITMNQVLQVMRKLTP